MKNTDLRQAYELFINLTQRELRGQFRRTLFGRLWSLANPLALMVVYTFVFAFIIRIQPPPGNPSGLNTFPLWLLCGLLPWIFFASVVNQGMGTLISNENLIRKVYFPRSVLVFSSAASLWVNWATEMAVLLLALVVIGGPTVLVYLPITVLLMVLLAMFSSGLALMLSIANVYFRDTQHFVAVLLQLAIYLTPVVYPISLIEAQSTASGPILGNLTILDLYNLNPMTSFVAAFRDTLYNQTFPSLTVAIYCAGWAVASLLIGLLVFRKNQGKLAELL